MASLPIVMDEDFTGATYGSMSPAAASGSGGAPRPQPSPSRRGGGRQRKRSRKVSTSEMFDNVERFSRRTISISQDQEIMNDVADVLHGAADEGDEDSINTSDAAASGSQGRDSTQCPLLPGDGDGERESANSISNFETIIHLLKGNIGMGVLTLPMAIRNAGLMMGSLGLAFIAFVCVYCMRMLVDAAHKACARRPNVKFLDYADTGEAALVDAGGFWPRWSKPMNKVINVFICLTQIGSNAVYALFIAQNLQPIFEHYGGDFFKSLNYRVYIAMVLPFMLAMCSIRNLRYLSPFSILANIIQFVGLGIIFYYIFSEPLPNSHSVPWMASSDRLPLFFGTAIFAIEGISVVLPIENQMKHPGDMLRYNGVLNTSLSLVAILYIGVGFFGYLKYGEGIKGSISLNLPPADVLAQVTLLLMSLAVFFSYALQFYVLMEVLGPNVIRPRVSQRWYSLTDYSVRVIINIFTFALAATVPWLDLFVSLLGSIKMSTLSLMAPAIIDTATNWHDLGRYKWKLWKNLLIFLFGFAGMILGAYVSMLNIVENFQKGESPDDGN